MTTRQIVASVRPARDSDLDAIESMLRANDLPIAGVRDVLEHFLVAVDPDAARVIGAIGLETYGTDALLRSAVVDPTWRNRQVGRSLVDHLRDAARDRGIHALYLLTTTAERFFTRLGFRVVDRADVPDSVRRSVEFVSACPASATVMMSTVDAAP